MTTMKTKLDNVEESLLKLFRIAMLSLMIGALLMVFIFGGVSVYLAMQAPKPPAPMKTAPDREIKLDDLKKALQSQIQKDEQEQKKKDNPETQPTSQIPNSLQYLEDTTALYRCALEFARRTGAQVEDEGNAVATEKVERLRANIEQFAAGPQRGGVWVKSAVQFTCAALADNDIVSWVKDAKIKGVFMSTLKFHAGMWDRIAQEKREFFESEQARSDSEMRAEELRVVAAKALALMFLYAAGVAFGVFMILAFYLLFSKIERNLRPLNVLPELVPRPLNIEAKLTPLG